MKTKAWAPLKKGDTIDMVAPGWACRPEELQGAAEFLRSQGFVPRWNPDIFKEQLLFANSHKERFRQLKAGLLAPDSQAVWCVRGGYGSLRLLPWLEKLTKPTKTKLFIGISDITSLHVFLNQSWGWGTVHAPLLDRVGAGKLSVAHQKELLQLCRGEKLEVSYRGLRPMNAAAKEIDLIEAPIVGGNLTVLQSSLGTPYQLQTRSKFLFLEDLGERGYRIDRMLEQLRQAGLFRGIKGILFGDFLGGEERDGSSLVLPVLQSWAAELPFPVISGLPCGHADIQRPLPLGTRARLEGGRTLKLHVPSGAQR